MVPLLVNSEALAMTPVPPVASTRVRLVSKIVPLLTMLPSNSIWLSPPLTTVVVSNEDGAAAVLMTVNRTLLLLPGLAVRLTVCPTRFRPVAFGIRSGMISVSPAPGTPLFQFVAVK